MGRPRLGARILQFLILVVTGPYVLLAWWMSGRSMGSDLEDDVRQAFGRLRPYSDGDPRAVQRLGSTYVRCAPCEGLGTAKCLAVGCGPQCATCSGTGDINCAPCSGSGMVWRRRAA